MIVKLTPEDLRDAAIDWVYKRLAKTGKMYQCTLEYTIVHDPKNNPDRPQRMAAKVYMTECEPDT